MNFRAMAYRIFKFVLGIIIMPYLSFAQVQDKNGSKTKIHSIKQHKHNHIYADSSAKKKAIRRVLIEKTLGKGLLGGEKIKK